MHFAANEGHGHRSSPFSLGSAAMGHAWHTTPTSGSSLLHSAFAASSICGHELILVNVAALVPVCRRCLPRRCHGATRDERGPVPCCDIAALQARVDGRQGRARQDRSTSSPLQRSRAVQASTSHIRWCVVGSWSALCSVRLACSALVNVTDAMGRGAGNDTQFFYLDLYRARAALSNLGHIAASDRFLRENVSFAMGLGAIGFHHVHQRPA